MEARVKIKLFGNFEMFVEGDLVLPQLRQAKKTTLLLEYLILKRGQAVPHEELLGMLWSEKESTNPATALRTLLHRYRSLVESSNIPELEHSVLTTRGAYQWNRSLHCEIDVYEFERLHTEAAKDKYSDEKRIELYTKMIGLYTGPLLINSADESFVVPKSVYYHDMYLESVFILIDLLKKKEAFEQIIQLCRKAKDVDMFDERLHLELMMALVKIGKKREALSQYYYASDLHEKKGAEETAGDIRAAYKMILQADMEMETDIENVQAMLEGEDEEKGALVCQYDIFKEIYQLQRRMVERSNSTIFLAMLSVGDMGDEPMDGLALDRIARQLCGVLQKHLRRGDTISRYSATQYVVLLPAVTYESGKQALDQVKQEFYATHVNSSVILTIKLRPLNNKKFTKKGEEKTEQ